MVKIRLRRFGRTHKPFYRLAAMDTRTKRDGKTIEELGTFDPLNKDEAKQINIDVERCRHWVSTGAQPSETAAKLLQRVGIELPKWVGKTKKRGSTRPKQKAAAAPKA